MSGRIDPATCFSFSESEMWDDAQSGTEHLPFDADREVEGRTCVDLPPSGNEQP
jgi:hypothetical protein